MNARSRTMFFIIAVVVLIIGWDAYTILSNGVETSISQVMIDWAYDYPVFPFSMGFVCGHLFWVISSSRHKK
jgi:hypothetical protein